MKNRLKVLRAERDWTQAQLAHALEVSRQTVNAIETGKFDPSLPLAFKIAEFLEMPIEEIFEPQRVPLAPTDNSHRRSIDVRLPATRPVGVIACPVPPQQATGAGFLFSAERPCVVLECRWKVLEVTDRFAQLRAEAINLMEIHSIPGLAMGMLLDGEEHTACLGVTSIENLLEVTEHTLFQVGSTTKTITATALMRLVEQGRLGLDDPVRDHVPELELADPAVAAAVTIRDLLHHTAGWAGDLFVDTGNGDDAAAKYVEKMKELAQLTKLGTLSVYNNAGFVLAGRIIEKVTGQTYEQAAGSLVLEPLRMNQSLFEPSEVILRRFAVGHNIHPDGRVEIAEPWPVPRSIRAAGGLVSTVSDQLRYARFQMGDGTTSEGSRLLSEQSMVEMQTPVVEIAIDTWVGISWMIFDLSGTKLVAHGGATTGHRSVFWFCPEAGISFTSLTNGSTGHLLNNKLSALAQKLFLGYERPEIEPLPVNDPGELEEYTGHYVQEPNMEVFKIRREGGALVLSLIDRGLLTEQFPDSPDMAPSTLHLYDDDKVIMRGGDLEGAKGTFIRDEHGAVTHLRTVRLWIKET